MVGVNPSCFVEDSFVEYIQEGLCNPRHVESDTWIIGIMFDHFYASVLLYGKQTAMVQFIENLFLRTIKMVFVESCMMQ